MTAPDITIPDEALEAAAIDLYRSATHSPQGFSWATLHPRVRERWRKNARAACLAMLKAWPGMTTDGRELHFSTARGAPVTTVKAYSIILPLPQENTNAEA